MSACSEEHSAHYQLYGERKKKPQKDSLHCWLRSPSHRLCLGRTETRRQFVGNALVKLHVLRGCIYRAGAVAAVCVVAGEDLELICPGFQVQFHSDHWARRH